MCSFRVTLGLRVLYRRSFVAPVLYLLVDTCRIPLRLSALLCALRLNALAKTAKIDAPFLPLTHPLIHAHQRFCDASPGAYSASS